MSGDNIEWQDDLPIEAQQRRETFARFGLAFYRAQCVERQIGILLATTHNPEFLRTPPEDRDRFYSTEFTKTLGRLVSALGERTVLVPELEARLRRAVELRNWLAHHYFWERAADLLSWEGRERMIAELQEAMDFLGTLDGELTTISIEWLKSQGVTIEAVLAEMAKYGSDQNA
jgi:hypothetical protein